MTEIKKNDEFEIYIEDMSEEGEGIGKVEGYTLFVKDAVVGDRVRARVIKTKKSYGYARLMEVLAPSPDRVTPRCPAAAPCGGCQLRCCRCLAWKTPTAIATRRSFRLDAAGTDGSSPGFTRDARIRSSRRRAVIWAAR